MSRRYCIGLSIDGVSTSKVLAILTAPSGKHLRLTYMAVTARGVLTAEQLSVGVHRVTSLGTPTVSLDNLSAGHNNVAAQQYDTGDWAANGQVRGDVTASPPTLAASPLRSEGVPNGTGFRWFNAGIVLAAGQSVAVKLLAAPANATGISVTLEWEEEG